MESFDITSVTLVVVFTANALQIAGILAGWLKRTPDGNLAEIRLSDGRKFRMNAKTDQDVFAKQLKVALKGL